MIRKTERLIVTFSTTYDAMAMEDVCRSENIRGRLIPLPKSISADCGLAWSTEVSERKNIEEIIDKRGLKYSGITVCEV